MRTSRLVAAILALALAGLAHAQEVPIYCNTTTSAACNTTTNPGNGSQGEAAWQAFGKVNAWAQQLGLFALDPANEVLATPSGATGIPSLRALVGLDIPPINLALTTNGGITGILPAANGGTGDSSGLAAGLSGAPTTGQFWGYNGTTQGWATPTGSGTINSGTLNQLAYYAAPGTAASGLNLGNGLSISSGTLNQSAINRTVTGTTDTISCTTDAGNGITYDSASAVAVTVPQATGSCGYGFGFYVQNKGSANVVLTPTTSTINGAASLTIPSSTGCEIDTDVTSGNYDVFACSAVAPSVAGGITLENGGTSLGTVTTLNCSTGTTCAAASGVGTITSAGGSFSLGSYTTVLTTLYTTTSSVFSSILSLPAAPASTTVRGQCSIWFTQNGAGPTATFGMSASAAPTDLYVASHTDNATTTVSALAYSATITSTATTQVTQSLQGMNGNIEVLRIEFSLINGSSSNVITLYGEQSGATLNVEPGSSCGWLP